ncbi:DUF6064 family protein [Marinobacter arenosus]|uniref:DUF6064 family protein n=1 Tax=Marinobacter arenosus TaxID=2856822 RepID=UPI001C4D5354|nr:DUF6064 family protein [Marinobacter arenosus]MBW0148935.1 hypothetical protein [Marinobacter arenosus]
MSGSAWLSYSLQDFLMFGPEVFLRLFVRINQDVWPWQLFAVFVSAAVPWMLCRPESAWHRLALVIVAAAWMGSGAGFLVHYFGEINWPAAWLGWAFVIQGGLVMVLSLTNSGFQLSKARAGWFALCWLAALALLPWLPVIQSGQLKALALFGLAPGVTVAASALLMGVYGRAVFWWLLPVPIIGVLFSAATYWTLQTPWLLPTPLTTLAFMGVGVWLSPRPAQNSGRQSARPDPVRR